jgi:hypothetical protein
MRSSTRQRPMQRASGRRRGGLGGSLLMVLAACSSSSGDATRANEDGGPAVDGTAPATSDALAPAPDANASDSSGLDIDAGGAAGDAGLETSDGAGGADAAGDVGAEAGTTMSVYVTFYGWADNSPPRLGLVGEPQASHRHMDEQQRGRRRELAPAMRGRLDSKRDECRGEPARRSPRDYGPTVRSIDEHLSDVALKPRPAGLRARVGRRRRPSARRPRRRTSAHRRPTRVDRLARER